MNVPTEGMSTDGGDDVRTKYGEHLFARHRHCVGATGEDGWLYKVTVAQLANRNSLSATGHCRTL